MPDDLLTLAYMYACIHTHTHLTLAHMLASTHTGGRGVLDRDDRYGDRPERGGGVGIPRDEGGFGGAR